MAGSVGRAAARPAGAPRLAAAVYYLRRRWVLYPLLGFSLLANVGLAYLYMNWWLVV